MLQLWSLGLLVMVLYGLARVNSVKIALAYLVVSIASVWPARLWLEAGRAGEVPILPFVGLIYLQFYALPMVGKDYSLLGYQPEDVLSTLR